MRIQTFQSWLIQLTIFLIPLFFLPFTQDVSSISKQYLLVASITILLLSSLLELVKNRKIKIDTHKSDIFLGLFWVCIALSTIIMSPNKIQAVLNPTYGLITISCFILFALFVRARRVSILTPLLYGAFLTSVLLLIFNFINPFASTTLPPILAFLGERFFSPVGSYIDTFVYLLSTTVLIGISISTSRNHSRSVSESRIIPMIMLVIIGCTSLVCGYRIATASAVLPSVQVSWDASVNTLKTPQSGLLGVGVDNYPIAYTQSKTREYANSPLWNTNFRTASSAYLHVWTETGILSLMLLLAWIWDGLRKKMHAKDWTYVLTSSSILLAGLVASISFIWMFLLFISIGATQNEEVTIKELSVPKIASVTISILVSLLLCIGGFFLGKAYAAEIWYKQALLNTSSGTKLYNYHRTAIAQNPYIEKYRITFSQVNLLIANSIATKKDLTQAEKQTITQTIQQSISEAKAAVKLNPQKPSNWANLATIYKSLVGVAKGSDVWAISTYQRAILLDPMNPTLRLNLGGVYYTLKKYPLAIESFRQAVQLRGSVANYQYNLAWALYQNKDVAGAVTAMTNTLSLIQDKKSADYTKATSELKMFKKALEDSKNTQPSKEPLVPSETNGSLQNQEPLTIPSPIPTGTKKITLPDTAQPPLDLGPNEATKEAGK